MLERLADLPPGIDGVKAVGAVSRDDYVHTVEPTLEDAVRTNRRVRFLYELGPELDNFTVGAAWEDMRVGIQFLRVFEGCALVTDVAWVREATRLVAFAIPCPVRVFGMHERAEAIAWLESLPEPASASVRMIAEAEVVVFEPEGALRASDFDALVRVVDGWIERRGDLHGLVIHTREFPGWENIASMRRHVRFVRDHRRKIRRVALATNSKLAGLVVGLAEIFVAPKVRRFRYDELDQAVAWARGSVMAESPEHHAAV